MGFIGRKPTEQNVSENDLQKLLSKFPIVSEAGALALYKDSAGNLKKATDITIDESGNISLTGSNGITISGSQAVTQAYGDANYKDVMLSGVAAYHLLSGRLTLDNKIITAGFSTTLHTGNGTTQNVDTGVDMDSQWGNDTSETFGGLIWGKERTVPTSTANNHNLYDTVRGATKGLATDLTSAEFTSSEGLTSFNSNGFSLGSGGNLNELNATNVSWNFQTTHRISGTTNHGKPYTCHYNPFTGFTIIKYEGSGIAEHEIPHHLGRELGFSVIKNLLTTNSWQVNAKGIVEASNFLYLDLASGIQSDVTASVTPKEDCIVLSTQGRTNTAANQYIIYGWANSYFDEENSLIGNYEVGVYVGTGASGNKVVTRGKPALFIGKRIDASGDWWIQDNMRSDNFLLANTIGGENSNPAAGDYLDFVSDGFITKTLTTQLNSSGARYLYMVVYDNDSGSGKSKYSRATDESTLALNALVPYANGIDSAGAKVSIAYKNETITLSNSLASGKNYIASLSDGTYVATPYEPMYLMRDRARAEENPDYFDLGKQKWFATTGGSELVTNGTFDSATTGWTAKSSTLSVSAGSLLVTADASGDSAYQALSLTIGKKYTVKGNILLGTATGARISVTPTLGSYASPAITTSSNTTGSYTFTFTATASSMYLELLAQSSGTVYFDNISCFEFEVVPTIGSEITSRNYLDCIVYADQNGQPTYVEQIEKTQYFGAIKANDFLGRNTVFALATVDLTTSPITVLSSYNISAAILTGKGRLKLFFSRKADHNNFQVFSQFGGASADSWGFNGFKDAKIDSVEVDTLSTGNAATNPNRVSVAILGGSI